MIRAKTHGAVFLIAAGLVCLARPLPVLAVAPVSLSGSIGGLVTNTSGVPQMGATVFLYNRFERLFQKVLTDEKGTFTFSGLLPDVYSVRVTLASFVPAVKSQILVQPGMRSVLNVSLASLFSSIQVVFPSAEHRALMSDDWRWTLRSASETRPVLRYLPGRTVPGASHAAVFSNTRGVLKLSAGESDLASTFQGDSDLATAFALATSLHGNSLLQFSGGFGHSANSGAPSAAFRTSFTRDIGGASPEVSVTMRQLFLPGRLGAALAGNENSLPALRSMSLSFEDTTQLADDLSLEYGFSLDSISFLDRLNYFSPFARLAYDAGDSGLIEVTYISGNARPELGSSGRVNGTELQRDLNTLALFPRVSLHGGRARVQRGENLEISYSRRVGSRTFKISGFRESVTNAALTMAAPDGMIASGDILPDLYSSSAVFNAGDYQAMGYTVSATQAIGEHFSASMIYGSQGALTADANRFESENPDELRAMIRAGRRHAATLRTTATLPASGTYVIASYQWTDHSWISPGRLYSVRNSRPDPGFNIYVRQPVPGWSALPWRMEITADLRNLLAQGYLALPASAGRRVYLMQTPRSFRGGLSFIF